MCHKFDEEVTFFDGDITLACPQGTAIAFTVGGDETDTITLTPNADLPAATTCKWDVLSIADLEFNEIAQTVSGSFTTAGGETPTNGPIVWYKFDETANSTTFADGSGNNANANCTGGTCPTAGAQGRIGQAVQFDGTDDRISAAVNSPAGAFTFAAWVNYSGAAWSGWHTVLEFGDDAPWFGVNESGQLSLYPSATGGTVSTQQWTHVAVTTNGTSVLLYVNGQQVGTGQTAPPTGGQGLLVGFETGTTSPWQGLLDDVRIYNRSLSAAEIGQLAKPDTNAPITVPEPEPIEPTRRIQSPTKIRGLST